jgi:hypothetical protein
MSFFGAPLGKTQRKAFKDAVVQRFTTTVGGAATADYESAASYATEILDRQINKANGLLTYNGLLLTAFTVLWTQAASQRAALLGSLCALAASAPLVGLFHVSWGKPGDFSSHQNEFETVWLTVFRRTYWITTSVWLSLLATAFAVWVVLRQIRI